MKKIIKNKNMEEKKNNRGQNLGVASLITAIMTFILAVIPCVGLIAIIPGIIAIVLAAVGLSQAATSGSPRGTLIAGLIIAIIASMISISQFFIAGNMAKKINHWPMDFTEMIEEVQDDLLRDLEDANISIKVESNGEKVEINTGVNKLDMKERLKELEELEGLEEFEGLEEAEETEEVEEEGNPEAE
jgi:hypothetical protein